MAGKRTDFINGSELLELCKKRKLTISQVMFQREIDLFDADAAAVKARMLKTLNVMRESVSKKKAR